MPEQHAHQPNAAHTAMLHDLAYGRGNDALVAEVSALRQEIAALRAELAPVPSLIITGQQAVADFQRLTRALQAPVNVRR